jgi:hypothetical protein
MTRVVTRERPKSRNARNFFRVFSESAYIEIIGMSGINRPRVVPGQIVRMVLREASPFVGHLLEGYGGFYHAKREARFEGEASE